MNRTYGCPNLWLVAVLAGALSVSTGARAADDEPLRVTLTSRKVVAGANGAEALQPAEQAKPGDLLQYAAVYSNASDRALANIQATLPIPAGTALQAGTARPVPTAGSLDGAKFEPFPLKRQVKQADGTEKEVLVPAHEYRALRWSVPRLVPGASVTVQARAQLTPVKPTE